MEKNPLRKRTKAENMNQYIGINKSTKQINKPTMGKKNIMKKVTK